MDEFSHIKNTHNQKSPCQTEKGDPGVALQDELDFARFNLNFFNRSNGPFPLTAADRDFKSPKDTLQHPKVLYRQLLDTPIWHGSADLLIWGWGYACVLSPTGPLWVPAKAVKLYHELDGRPTESWTGDDQVEADQPHNMEEEEEK